MGLALKEVRAWAAEFHGKPEIHFVAIPRTEMHIHGDFEARLAGWLPPAPTADDVVVPIHPGQWHHIHARVPTARLLPETRPALAQTSVRRC